MAVKVNTGWACGYCGKVYDDPTKADMCRDSHELIYIPLTHAELNALLNFIYTKEDDLLTESLMKTLQRYLRGN